MKAIEGKRYRHYKNHEEYVVVVIARDSDTCEEVVVYEGQYNSTEFGDHPIWVRNRVEFEEKVHYKETLIDRFTEVEI